MNAFLFAGIAMLFWGIAPIFGKLGLGYLTPLAALTIRSLVVSAVLVVAVTVMGQWSIVTNTTAKSLAYISLEGLCAALLGQLAYYYALKLGEVGRVSPVVAAFPLVALLLSALIFGEKLTIYKVVATLLIVSGVILLKY